VKKDFQKFLYIPKPDHASRLAMWQNCLADHIPNFDKEMNFALLAKLSDSWTLGNIKKCAEDALEKHYDLAEEEMEEHLKPYEFDPEKYLKGALMFKPVKIGRKRIRMEDILESLSLIDPLFLEQEKAWTNWFNKTPLQKARIAAQFAGGADKKKKGKGKGKDKDKKGGRGRKR
jgi:SpoVK/Ycf46/Vps4 family AAA+-type ATPase